MERSFFDLSRGPVLQLAPSVRARLIFGGRMMLSVVEIDPHAEVAAHAHPHEQLGLVILGDQELTIGGKTMSMNAFEGYAIPPGVEHGARAGPHGVTVVDAFAPPRDDYLLGWNSMSPTTLQKRSS